MQVNTLCFAKAAELPEASRVIGNVKVLFTSMQYTSRVFRETSTPMVNFAFSMTVILVNNKSVALV